MTDAPNAEQVKYWNETAGPKWVAHQETLDRQLETLGRAAMDHAGVTAGLRVLDVGCGCGGTTLELARRVSPGGSVTGADISAPMLAHAERRAHGMTNVRFVSADAQTHAFPPASVDVVFSRFGVMFFADPAAAFANLRRALAPAGRLGFVCWQAVWENPWVLAPLQAAAQHVTLPPPPAPGAPGPFAFADAERVRGILDRAGFADIAFHDERQVLGIGGGGLDEATEFLLTAVGPLSGVLREMPDAIPRVRGAVRDALRPFLVDGAVKVPSAAWIVTARGA